MRIGLVAALVLVVCVVVSIGLIPGPLLSRQPGLSVTTRAATAGSGGMASGRVTVVATFYPLFEWAEAIGGNRSDVFNVVPPGVEPHDFEPSAADAKRLRTAHLILYQGNGFQPAVDRLLAALPQKGGPRIVNTAQGLVSSHPNEPEAHEDEKKHDEHNQAQGVDPHTWLDPVLAKRQVDRIATAYSEADPKNQDTYRVNAERYVAQLDQLHAEFRAGLRNCARREFVTSHAAFGYLASRYGLHQVAISGLSPEAEPSPRRLSELSRWAQEKDVKVIFFETLASPKVAQTLAREVGAKALVLNPLEGFTAEELKAGKNYLQGMRENLRNLRVALECKG